MTQKQKILYTLRYEIKNNLYKNHTSWKIEDFLEYVLNCSKFNEWTTADGYIHKDLICEIIAGWR